MNKKTIHILLAMMLAFSACTDEVSVDIPEQAPLLVINSFFTADSLWQAELSSTVSTASKPGKKLIENARLVLWQNNQPVDTMIEISTGNYVSDIQPVPGKTYLITAQAEGFPSVRATGTLPEMAVDFTILSLEPAEDLPTFSDENYELQLKIESTAQEQVFFNLSMYVLQENDSMVRVDSAFLANESLIDDQDEGRGITFSASELSEEGQLEVLIQKKYLAGKQLIVFLKTISPGYYQYEVSLHEHLNTIGTPFSQPVAVYSNVVDGYGIFAGYMIAADTISID